MSYPTLRVYALHKALFLIASGNKPLNTTVEHDSRTDKERMVFYFDRISAQPYASLWQDMYDEIMKFRDNGDVPDPDYLDEMQNRLWDRLEGQVPA